MSDPPNRPLFLTGDPDLLEELLRIAAGVDVEVEVAPDPRSAPRSYLSAPVVLIGPDAAEACARVARRRDVVLVGPDADDPSVWPLAVTAGAERVVFLPAAAGWLADRLADAATAAGERGRIVGVVGGRGGAGATTLAVTLAATVARRRWRALLVDLDPLGGGVDLVVGGERSAGMRWSQAVIAAAQVRPGRVVAGLPRWHDIAVLSWDHEQAEPLPVSAVDDLLDAGRRSYDVVVLDLPRSPDDAARAALAACDLVVLVVPGEVRAVASATRVVAGVRPHAADLRVVVRGPAPSGLAAPDIAETLGLPLAGTLRPEPGLSELLEHGEPPGRGRRSPLAAFCAALLQELSAVGAAAA